jgi:hypothetical protein
MVDQLLMLRKQRIIEHLDMCAFSAERGIPASPIVIQTCRDYIDALKQDFMTQYNVPEPVAKPTPEVEEPKEE